MRIFPPASFFSRFIGDSIIQVWLDPWAVRFLFGGGVQLYVQEGLAQTDADGTTWSYDCDHINGGPVVLQRLLYLPILSVVREDLSLTLTFDGGATLRVLTEVGPYESGHFELSGDEWVVF